MTCAERKELWPLYVRGSLGPAEAAALRAHLATGCTLCAGALAEARRAPAGDESVGRAEAEAIRAPIAVEPAHAAAVPAGGSKGLSPWAAATWGAVAAALLVGFTGFMLIRAQRNAYFGERERLGNQREMRDKAIAAMLTSQLAMQKTVDAVEEKLAATEKAGEELKARSAALLRDLDAAGVRSMEWVSLLQGRDMRIYDVPGTEKQPGAKGRMLHDVAANRYHFVAAGLRPLADGKVYTLWLTNAEGAVASGSFAVGADGVGMATVGTVTATPDRGAAPTAFSVTEEKGPGAKKAEGEVQMAGKV